MSAALTELINELSEAVAQLRNSLQNPLLADLEQVLARAQASLDGVNAWPGGSEALRQALDSLPPAQKDAAEKLLQQARTDHAVNAELLTLAMQRNTALQAEAALSSDAATYSSDRGYQMGSSGRLLGKF